MPEVKGPSKIVNIFPYKQNSCNFLTPPVPPVPVASDGQQQNVWVWPFLHVE